MSNGTARGCAAAAASASAAKTKRALGLMKRRMSHADAKRSMPGRGRVIQTRDLKAAGLSAGASVTVVSIGPPDRRTSDVTASAAEEDAPAPKKSIDCR